MARFEKVAAVKRHRTNRQLECELDFTYQAKKSKIRVKDVHANDSYSSFIETDGKMFTTILLPFGTNCKTTKQRLVCEK